MAKYDALARTALGLISRKGKEVTLSRLVRVVDPVTQAATESTQTEAYKVVGLPPGKSAEYRVGSLVNRNVIEFYLGRYGSTMAPSPGDKIPWGGDDYTLFHVTHYDPADDGAVLTVAYGER